MFADDTQTYCLTATLQPMSGMSDIEIPLWLVLGALGIYLIIRG